MKTKTFTLFSKLALTLSLMLCISVPSWANETYQLINQATGALTGDIRCDRTLTSAPVEIEGKDFTWYTTFSTNSTTISSGNNNGVFQRLFAYDMRTTKATIRAYVKAGSNNRNFYISALQEGATAEDAQTNAIIKNTSDCFSRTIDIASNPVNTTIFFYANGTDLMVYQIEIEESGAPLLRGGDPGYVLSFNQSRASFAKDQTPSIIQSIDSIQGVLKDNLRPAYSGTYATIKKNEGVNYLSFNVAVPCSLRMTFSNTGSNRWYNVSKTKNATDQTYNLSAAAPSTNTVYLDSRGKWYINASNNSDVQITKLEFLPINYAITFNNGGKGTAPENVEAARVILQPVTGGGIQLGWKANHDVVVEKQLIPANTLIAVGSPVCVMENTTFTAEWAASSWDVIFKDDYPDGQQIGETHQVGGGGYATEFVPTTDPAKANNVFKGWSVDGATVLNIATYAINANTTFYPVWNPIYTVNFKKLEADTDPYATAQVENGSTTTAPTTDPTREGYNFKGWSLNGTDIVNVAEQTISANTTFLAVWKEVYDVTFEKSTGVQYGDIQHIEKGSYATVPTNPDWYGKIFQYWSLDGTSEVDVAATQINAATTFIAVWQDLPTYTVSFDTKGGSAVPDLTALENDYLPAPPADPTREGYAFQGWSETDGGAVVSDITAIQITAPKTFYAVWEKTLNYDMFSLSNFTIQKLSNMDNTDPEYNFENDATVIGGAAYVGCTDGSKKKVFDNYRIDLGGNNSYAHVHLNSDLREGDVITITGTTVTNNVNYQFYLTYQKARAETISTTIGDNYTYTITSDSPLRGRTDFYIWRYNGKTARITAINITRPDVDEHINTFVSLSFDTNGATSDTPETQVLLQNAWPTTEPNAPFKGLHWIFQGWFKSDATEKFIFGNPCSTDIALTAQWYEAQPKTVRFYNCDAKIGDDKTIYEYETIPVAERPVDPTRTGYNFKGWATGEADDYNGVDSTLVDLDTVVIMSDTNFYAVWHKQITVTTIVEGVHTIYDSEETAYVNLPSPSRAGYIFAGWWKDSETENYNFDIPMGTEDVTFTAQWTPANPNEYVYAFDDAFHFDGHHYKDPAGQVFERINDEDEKAMSTDPYTVFASDGGITSIVVNNGHFNPRRPTDGNPFISSFIRLQENDATSKMVITIKEDYEATLILRASGAYGATNVTMTANDPSTMDAADPAQQETHGQSFNLNHDSIYFKLGAGEYTLTSSGNLFISNFTLTATEMPKYVKLDDLQINGTTVDGFQPLNEEYSYTIPYPATDTPPVTYSVPQPDKVTVSECWTSVGTDTIDYVVTVTANSNPSISRDYTIHFIHGEKDKLVLVRADYITNTTCKVTGVFANHDATEVYANNDTPVDGGYKFYTDYVHHIHLSIAGSGETFHEGDIVRAYITKIANRTPTTMAVYGNADGTDSIITSDVAGDLGINYVTLPAGVEGKTDIYLLRIDKNQWNPFIRYAEVVRTMEKPIITSFTLEGQAGVIDQSTNTITVDLPHGISTTPQTPVIETLNNDTDFVTVINPTEAQDFSAPVTYTLTDKDGDQNTYTVSVIYQVRIGNGGEGDDNANLAAYNGKKVNVNFTRPIDASNGDWYTLCLPFNMSAEQIAAAFGPCQLATLATSEWLSEYNLARIRHTHVSAIEAGVPYLFLPENSINGDVTIPGVTIDNTERPVTTTYVDFIGTFNPKALTDDGYTFYLDDNNMLYHPWENMTLRATRCYYHFHNLTPAQMQNIMARVMIDGDANHTPTTVEQITADPTINGKYILNGQLIIIRDGVEYNAQGQVIK